MTSNLALLPSFALLIGALHSGPAFSAEPSPCVDASPLSGLVVRSSPECVKAFKDNQKFKDSFAATINMAVNGKPAPAVNRAANVRAKLSRLGSLSMAEQR